MSRRVKSLEKKIRGKIIRILDKRTVIINLGHRDGIQSTSVFSILGKSEAIVDPFTEEELGRVNIVKSRVKAAQVEDKYTIATTIWREGRGTAINVFTSTFLSGEVVDEGELNVKLKDIQPWRSKTMKDPVQVGDDVEVAVPEQEDEAPGPASDSSDQEGN